ncbi:MBL fold metallo-hydrolase [Corynebacterium senegalense]|uniref:MBL fold metallo-hydrolase n=1 Tax=Corynebacterium senegalense TaxID=2080750 RepID=UPI0015F2868B|nr:MBL fold metallo-hydrolase [Corynebacterium senegalense]
MHLTDGETDTFVDAFLTRPSFPRLAVGHLKPTGTTIDKALGKGGVVKLDALFVAHSHHDHLMDAPAVVKKVGGAMYGSESTLNYGRGEGLSDAQMGAHRRRRRGHGRQVHRADHRGPAQPR